MNYELALKLKEAGFPQNVWNFELSNYAYCTLDNCCNRTLHLLHRDNDEGCNTGNDYSHRQADKTHSWVKVPTLSELIEACGDGFECIERTSYPKTSWRCGSYEGCYDGTVDFNVKSEGSTPKEAVVNLWLELNKK